MGMRDGPTPMSAASGVGDLKQGGDAVKVRRGVEGRRSSESPEGGAAGGAGLPPCSLKVK